MDKSNLRAAAQAVFTPGPYERTSGNSVYALGTDPRGRTVNRMFLSVYAGWADGKRTSQEECDATAALLRVAPDLYEALRALIDGFDHVANCRECGEMSPESCAGGGGGPALEARAQAVAAVAKAEGRSAPTAPPETP